MGRDEGRVRQVGGLFFWVLTAGILGMYVYGLFLDIFGPLELGALSFIWTTTRERRGF